MKKNPWQAGIEQVSRRLERVTDRHREVALMMIDVRGVDRLYATLGHERVFQLLTEFHGQLEALCRESDEVIRLTDRKFALIITGFRNRDHVGLAAHKVQRLIKESSSTRGDHQTLGVRIGIALPASEHPDTDELLRRAEVALVESERRGQAITFFETSSAEQLDSEWQLSTSLAGALETADLELFYQPKLELKSGAIVGAEALLRWRDPDFGTIPTQMLVEIAENSSLIPALTHFSIHRACRQLKEWESMAPDLTVAVNITPSIIRDLEVVNILDSATRIWNVDAALITLEVTENALIIDADTGYRVLSRLRDSGARVSIDDFGTGYSSLAYLKDIPADELKIDRSFVFQMLTDSGDYRIVEHAISIGKSFGLTVVAEGVSNEETLNELRSMGCDLAQGHYLCEPLANNAFMQWYAEHAGMRHSSLTT